MLPERSMTNRRFALRSTAREKYQNYVLPIQVYRFIGGSGSGAYFNLTELTW